MSLALASATKSNYKEKTILSIKAITSITVTNLGRSLASQISFAHTP